MLNGKNRYINKPGNFYELYILARAANPGCSLNIDSVWVLKWLLLLSLCVVSPIILIWLCNLVTLFQFRVMNNLACKCEQFVVINRCSQAGISRL
jgi:hypothetical protein